MIGDPSTHFRYDIVYQQQHKSRDLNACLSVRSFCWSVGKYTIFMADIPKQYLIDLDNFYFNTYTNLVMVVSWWKSEHIGDL